MSNHQSAGDVSPTRGWLWVLCDRDVGPLVCHSVVIAEVVVASGRFVGGWSSRIISLIIMEWCLSCSAISIIV